LADVIDVAKIAEYSMRDSMFSPDEHLTSQMMEFRKDISPYTAI